MSVSLYMDEHVPPAITEALLLRGVDVLTVQEESREGADDPAVLDHASSLNRVLFTRDEDFLKISAERQRDGVFFAGIVYAHQLRVSIGRCIRDLELIGIAGRPEEFENRLYHRPFRG